MGLLLDRSWWVVGFFALLTVVLAFGLTRLTLDDSFDHMFPDEAPATELNDRIQEVFGSNQLTIAVLSGDIYTQEALGLLDRLTSELGDVQGVEDVTSVANAQRMEDDDGFLVVEDLVDPARLGDDDIERVRSFLASSYLYRDGMLVSEDGRSATVVMQVDDEADPAQVVRGIRETLDPWPGEVHLTGVALLNVELRTTISRELGLLTGLSALVIVVMLFLNFRTVRGALLPLLTVVIGLIWSFGAAGLAGIELSVMDIVAPVAILAVGSSFSLHLLGRYYLEVSKGTAKREAIRLTVVETGLGVLISGLAISAAISTFALSGIPAVRVLGPLIAGGVASSLVAAMILLPAIQNLLPLPSRLPDPDDPGAIGGLLRSVARLVRGHRWAVLVVAAALAGVAAIGITRIQANTAILNYFGEDSEVRQGYDVVEDVAGGSSRVQVLVEGDLQDPELLSAMLSFQERVAEVEGAGRATSIATVIRAIHETLTGEAGLPSTREAVAQELLVYQLSGDVAEITRYMTLDGGLGLIDIPTTSASTQEVRRIYGRIRELAEGTIAEHASLGYGGMSLVQLALEDALLHDLVISLSLAVLLVIIVDSLVRSVRAALVTILALLVTIALQYGALGLLGLPLDLATMLLGALAIGVGDYAIHLTVRYMEERRRTTSPEAAMDETIQTSGRSILFTALTLGGGFAALIFSRFVPIRTLGYLMAFTVTSIGVTSLTVLPAACLIFLRNPRAPRTPRKEVDLDV